MLPKSQPAFPFPQLPQTHSLMEDFDPTSVRPSLPLGTNHHNHRRRGQINTPRSRRRSPQRFKVPPGHVAFRLFCNQSAIGGVIGNNGAVVSQLRRETDTKIHLENSAPGSDYGVVLVIGSRSRDRTIALTAGEGDESGREEECRCDVSGAQEAMIRVLDRIWMLEAPSEGGGGGGTASRMVWCRLLAHGSQIRVVMGKGGTNIVRMRKQSGADIRILPEFSPGGDEVIQIAGTVLAVKKALFAVSLCLQDHPPQENGPTFFSGLTESSSFGASHVSDTQAEFFPNLASLLPQTAFNNNAPKDSLAIDANGVSNNDTKSTRQEVVFRLLCSNYAAGSVIGKKGAIVRALENETGATIRFAAPTTGSIERIVTISALENLGSGFSPAQNAVILVFARSVEGDIEKGFILGFSQGATVTAKLLVAADLVGRLSEDEGKVISDIREVSGADIHILGGDSGNQVVQIIGEYKTVQDALFQVTGSLRDHLLPREVLNEVRARSSFGRVSEPTSSGPHQSLGLFHDSDDEALLTGQMNRLGLSHSVSSFPLRSQLPQTVESGHSKAITNVQEVLTKFGGDLEVSSGNKLAIVTNTIVEIVVSRHAFGSIYGEDGDNLNRLREISGAKVEVYDPRLGENEGKLVISGTPDQTLAAQSLLQAFIQTANKS
ncbi:KH domain-containing protein HEN4 isoform X3 [Morus notabilis]|uniref:KH domain-containing protein HEN4 isoform X3 n=1 Tax=Morus notabilis TaxID=981085 RepID=UPI000CED55E5|nr:KH domain-containing protein HEN4 isoform X3 [Morus notabilis]